MDEPLSTTATVGELVRHWRTMRKMSQAKLAERTGISVRHLSFVERGKALPSREMLDWLSQALGVPAEEHRTLLEAGGYYGGYVPSAVDGELDEETEALLDETQALAEGLRPALVAVHDIYGTLLRWNSDLELVLRALGIAIEEYAELGGGHRFVLALKPMMDNWDDLALAHLRRMHDELVRSQGPMAARIESLMEELLERIEDVDAAREALTRSGSHAIMTDMHFHSPLPLRLRSCITTLGTAASAKVRALRLRILVPEDEASRQALATLRAQALEEAAGPR